jgi:arylsulfatase A-like enzyme
VRPHYGVVTDRFKLVHFNAPDADYWELYDRHSDPLELTSVYDRPDYADVQRTLRAELDRLRLELGVPQRDPPESRGPVPRKQSSAAG